MTDEPTSGVEAVLRAMRKCVANDSILADDRVLCVLASAAVAALATPAASPATEAAAWRAVAHPETGMGTIVGQMQRAVTDDADRLYGKGRWDLQALVVSSGTSDPGYNVSEAHMFGPVEPAPPASPSPAPAAVEANPDVFNRLLTAAKLLCANAEGCAINHHGEDFATHGLPGWLTSCASDIEAASAVLHSSATSANTPTTPLCDCERGHNGLGIAGRECDCSPASPSPAPAAVDVDDYWNRPLTERLRERASLARSEGTGTAVADANHFDEAATALSTLAADKATLEKLRPHWAQGYSSDSIAAQVTVTALAALWELLEAKDQTEAAEKLKTLVADKARLVADLRKRDKVFCAMLSTGVCDLPARLEAAEAASTAKDKRIRELEALTQPDTAPKETK